jgi:hypothetical protein
MAFRNHFNDNDLIFTTTTGKAIFPALLVQILLMRLRLRMFLELGSMILDIHMPLYALKLVCALKRITR